MPQGFMFSVAMHQAEEADLQADPATWAAWEYLQRTAPIRPGESLTHFRFWMTREGYQTVSPAQTALFVHAVQHYMNTPRLAFTFLTCADPDFWAAMFGYADLIHLPEAGFESDGKRYGVYGHDWRTVPAAAWLDMLAERETGMKNTFQVRQPRGPEPMIVLSQPDFAEAVQNALRNFSLPDRLRDNPLVQSRLVVQRAGVNSTDHERYAALQDLLREALETVRAAPREVKFYRALFHTYVQPAASQEQAAELLDVPFGTFRRHLRSGIERVTELLWQLEITGTGRLAAPEK
jgi:hypothetical protein